MKQAFATPRLTDAELFEIFPEAKVILPELLAEREHIRAATAVIIEDQLATIAAETSDEMSRCFWRQWVKLNAGADLLAIDRNIGRFRRQLRVAQGFPLPSGTLTDDQIQAAREVPIEDLLDQQFKRGGSTLVGLCPFHDDRRPSFHIYPKENRGWCFACNQGGNAIDIAVQLHGCGFREAVLLLTGAKS